ncbi:MAG: flagellar hook-associated protein FlgK [Lachnospiraceae bacterium]|nr:flagellar hook-associated protein FlgK [Lachnospiraceae bacterium]
MASQFFGLNIAYTGLLASNAALNTTANNISNVDTEGYSRQHVDQTAAAALRTFTTFGCAGAGVDVHGVERIRNEFYDVKFWNNNAILGEYDKKEYYAKQIQDYFLDDSTIKGFTTVFDEMYQGLAEVKKSAGDATVKAQFVGLANNLATYFNEMSEDLSKIQEDINQEIKVKVEEINSYAKEIATLNKQINTIEVTGPMANELRDQRTVLVDKLSKIIDVTAVETPIIDVNNPDRVTGANRFLVRIAGGQTLVDYDDYHELTCVSRETGNKAYQSDNIGLYDIMWANGAEFGMYNASMGGELFGLIQMRDGNNGEYFRGTAASVTKDGDGNGKIVVDVTDSYLMEMDKSTLTPTGTIVIGNVRYKYNGWEYSENDKQYTFNLLKAENEEDIKYSLKGAGVTINQDVEYQGIPYYQEQLNEWVRLFSKSFNEILTTNGAVNEYGEAGRILFTANLADASQATFGDEDPADGIIKSGDINYRLLTASNFAINKDLIEDANRLATHTDSAAGHDKYDVIEKLIDMRTDMSIVEYRGNSAGHFLESILADVALNAERSETFRLNAETIGNSIDNQRTSISGVDQDEEAVNLVKFQNAYNLSSKVIQVLTEIYDRLILETGV